jgi:DNA invertase Pin-like site-specific DNA recombinase
MSRVIGYVRPSSGGQSVQAQSELLKAAGASKIYQEQADKLKHDRPQLDILLAAVNEGDMVITTSLDRIARNTKHLQALIESLSAAGVTLRVLDSDIDTSQLNGETLRTLLGIISQFERQVARERQSEGIAKARREGRYKGRKPTAMAKAEEVLELNEQGLTRQKIADELGIGVASVYRILQKNKFPKKTHKKVQKKSVDKPKRDVRKIFHEPEPEQLSFF